MQLFNSIANGVSSLASTACSGLMKAAGALGHRKVTVVQNPEKMEFKRNIGGLNEEVQTSNRGELIQHHNKMKQGAAKVAFLNNDIRSLMIEKRDITKNLSKTNFNLQKLEGRRYSNRPEIEKTKKQIDTLTQKLNGVEKKIESLNQELQLYLNLSNEEQAEIDRIQEEMNSDVEDGWTVLTKEIPVRTDEILLNKAINVTRLTLKEKEEIKNELLNL